MCMYPGGQVAECANFRVLFSGVLSPSVHTSGHRFNIHAYYMKMQCACIEVISPCWQPEDDPKDVAHEKDFVERADREGERKFGL